MLLDERWRRRPVGLIAADREAADAPFIGPLYYLQRALGPFTEVREGTISQLLTRDLSVIVLADDAAARRAGARRADPMGGARAGC